MVMIFPSEDCTFLNLFFLQKEINNATLSDYTRYAFINGGSNPELMEPILRCQVSTHIMTQLTLTKSWFETFFSQ
jgi:hypothetical protein